MVPLLLVILNDLLLLINLYYVSIVVRYYNVCVVEGLNVECLRIE